MKQPARAEATVTVAAKGYLAFTPKGNRQDDWMRGKIRLCSYRLTSAELGPSWPSAYGAGRGMARLKRICYRGNVGRVAGEEPDDTDGRSEAARAQPELPVAATELRCDGLDQGEMMSLRH